jgi:hypothetical protein
VGPALVNPGRVMKVASFTSSVQVSGVGCQVSATEVDRWIGVAHEMDFLSPVLTVSPNPISVQNLGFVFPDT